MTEQWKDLVGYEGLYKISDQGNVWSERRQRMLSTKPNKHRGYPEFGAIDANGKQRTMTVHQEIMRAFVGPLPPGRHVRHIDGNPLNNNLSNLAYGTPKQNMDDRRDPDYLGAKLLTIDQIEKIKHDAARGMRAKDIALKHDVDLQRLPSILDKNTIDIRRELMLMCIKAGCGVEITGKYFDVTPAAITHSIKRHYGGVRQLRKSYPINTSLTVKDIPHIIGLK
jgi:hypothetical protein